MNTSEMVSVCLLGTYWYTCVCVGVCVRAWFVRPSVCDIDLRQIISSSSKYTRCCVDTIDSPDDEHEVARNMQRIEINI